LLSVVFLDDALKWVPLAALSGFLFMVALDLIEVKKFFQLVKQHPFQAFLFLCPCVGTLMGHMLLGLALSLTLHMVHVFTRLPFGLHRHADTLQSPWSQNLSQKASISPTAFVHPKASIIGRVVIGDHVHIAADTSVRADEGTPFYIGANSNIQDGVVIHGLKNKTVPSDQNDWSVYIGKNVSLGHQALIHGPCFIGDNCFVGFKAIVHDSTVGSQCFIGFGAIVVGVNIPDSRYVPHGTLLDSQDKVDALTKVSDSQLKFNEDVVEVNTGLVDAYRNQ